MQKKNVMYTHKVICNLRSVFYVPLMVLKQLRLLKQFCELLYMPFPDSAPTFVSTDSSREYLDNYASHFKLSPQCRAIVELASHDEWGCTWNVVARDRTMRFLVVVTGENLRRGMYRYSLVEGD